MNLFDLMAAERAEVLQALERCIQKPESARLTGMDAASARKLMAHVSRQQRVLMPALRASSHAEAHALFAIHRHAASLAAACAESRASAADVASRLRRAVDALRALDAHEHERLRPREAELFGAIELRRMAGAWRLDAMSPKAIGLRERLGATARQWLRRALRRQRSLPVLRDAVFVYRGCGSRPLPVEHAQHTR